MPQLTGPPVQLLMESYWQLVDVIKMANPSSSAIHKYNSTTNSWDLISMPTARYECLVAVLPTNEMMVVGGYDKHRSPKSIVEIADYYLPIGCAYSTHRCLELEIWRFSCRRRQQQQQTYKPIALPLAHARGVITTCVIVIWWSTHHCCLLDCPDHPDSSLHHPRTAWGAL